MTWIMSGYIIEDEGEITRRKEPVKITVEADSMDEAFEKARAMYGRYIDTAQPA